MTVKFNTREFDKALAEYAVASKKDLVEICNRQALNLAMRSMQFTPKAKASEIRSVSAQDWWPKLIAKKLRKSATLRTAIAWKLGYHGAWIGGYSREEAREYSRRVIVARTRSIAFVRSGWITAAQTLARIVGQQVRVLAKQYGRKKGGVAPAVAGRATAEIWNTVDGVERVGAPAFHKAMAFVTRDMRAYGERKMAQRARQFSAAGAGLLRSL